VNVTARRPPMSVSGSACREPAAGRGPGRADRHDVGGFRRQGRAQTAHDPGPVLADPAVMIADGGEVISDIVALSDQPTLFGPVASDSTCWRVLDAVNDDADLAALAAARARAREVAWIARGEVTGTVLPPIPVAGRDLRDPAGRPVLVIDLDATIVIAHSEKEQAAATFTWGYHPLLAFCDNTREALAGQLRAGNAGSNTAADHLQVLAEALGKISDDYRHGYPILIRADGAGSSQALLAGIAALPNTSVAVEFSVGWAITERERRAIRALPAAAWTPAIETSADPRDGADIAELTGLLPASYLAGMQVTSATNGPTPARSSTCSENADGYRYTACATTTAAGQHDWLGVRHRAHARVEDRIRCGNRTFIGRFPSRQFNINQAWLVCALTAIDLLAWTQTTHSRPALVRAEPKHSATGCCTSPPDSPPTDADIICASTRPGGMPRARHRLRAATRAPRTRVLNPSPSTHQRPRTPRHQAGRRTTPRTRYTPTKINRCEGDHHRQGPE